MSPDNQRDNQASTTRKIRSGPRAIALVGPYGSGKTSLIHFIYGLRTDYDGEILFQDKSVRCFSPEELARFRQENISIIFQDMRLFEKQTARQNIEIKRALRPYHPMEKIDEMARRLGVYNKLNQVAMHCSYGEQQRIAIIRALMQPFDFLLLDEPYSHLDENNREKAMELIYEECGKRKAAMIFADLKSLDFLKNESTVFL